MKGAFSREEEDRCVGLRWSHATVHVWGLFVDGIIQIGCWVGSRGYEIGPWSE